MRVIDPITPRPEDCRASTSGYYDAPPALTPGPEGRLLRSLRDAARPRDPIQLLVRAAEHFYIAKHFPRGFAWPVAMGNVAGYATALADLAVTGRAAWSRLRQHPPTESALLPAVRAALEARFREEPLVEADLRASVQNALERAHKVAWALRGPVGWRLANRHALRWIAVAGEEDAPHRPVNVPSAPFPQYDITVRTRGLDLTTRFMVASPGIDHHTVDTASIHLNQLPREPALEIAPDDQIILFIHGHSSRLEESLDLIPKLHAFAATTQQRYCIIAFDLPNNGYASMFDHTRVAPATESKHPGGYPILQFIEEFIVNFVNELDRRTPVKDRIAAVIGGSLGGNMVLRLAERDPAAVPWIRTMVAWSPASVWNPIAGDPLKNEVHAVPREEMNEAETENQRADYFKHVFEGFYRFVHVPAQTKSWYRSDWPCRDAYVKGARSDRKEIYNASYRRWHWRVAFEQLLFSHRTPARYEAIRSRLLLAAGEKDDDHFLQIYDASRALAPLMRRTPGRTLFIKNCGHSIHNEYPALLAGHIDAFLREAAGEGKVRRLGSYGSWRKEWKAIVPGDFGGDGYTDLLFYDPARGEAELYASDGRGGLRVMQRFTGWKRDWDLIVPGRFAGNGRTDLFFYSSARGQGEIWVAETGGSLRPIRTLDRLGRSWSNVIPGDFGGDTHTDLLFYDAAAGSAEFHAVNREGALTKMQSYSGWRKEWSHIVPGNFHGQRYTDLLFYDPTRGEAETYSTREGGAIDLIRRHTGWGRAWSHIVPGTFGGGWQTDLLFYEPTRGHAELYTTAPDGRIQLLRALDGWRPNLTRIVPGAFGGDYHTDLLWYAADEGVAEFLATA